MQHLWCVCVGGLQSRKHVSLLRQNETNERAFFVHPCFEFVLFVFWDFQANSNMSYWRSMTTTWRLGFILAVSDGLSAIWGWRMGNSMRYAAMCWKKKARATAENKSDRCLSATDVQDTRCCHGNKIAAFPEGQHELICEERNRQVCSQGWIHVRSSRWRC